MKALRLIVPPLTLILVTVLAVLPWGLSAENRFVLPLLPAAAIHYWRVRRPEAVPVWFVFLMGVTVDVLTDGPLGYWSLIYLIGFALASFAADWSEHGAAVRLAAFAGALGALCLAEWGLASLYFAEWSDWLPRARAYGLAILAYLLTAFIFRAVDGRRSDLTGRRLLREV